MDKFEKEVNRYLTSAFQDCKTSFIHNLMKDEYDSHLCSLHILLSTENDHNCIPCNVDEKVKLPFRYLKNRKNTAKAPEDFIMYLVSMQPAIATIEEVYDKIIKPLSNHKTFHDYFDTMPQLKKWINFIKHPKHFVAMSHHPIYNFTNSGVVSPKVDLTIDYNFVKEYYTKEGNKNGEDLRTKLYKELYDKKSMLIVYPNALDITNGFCDDVMKFMYLIEFKNGVSQAIQSKATLKNFFVSDYETQ